MPSDHSCVLESEGESGALALLRLLGVVRLCAIFLAVTSEQHVKIIFGKIFFKPSGF